MAGKKGNKTSQKRGGKLQINNDITKKTNKDKKGEAAKSTATTKAPTKSKETNEALPPSLRSEHVVIPDDIYATVVAICSGMYQVVDTYMGIIHGIPFPEKHTSLEHMVYYLNTGVWHYGSFEIQIIYEAWRRTLSQAQLIARLEEVQYRNKIETAKKITENLLRFAREKYDTSMMVNDKSVFGNPTKLITRFHSIYNLQ